MAEYYSPVVMVGTASQKAKKNPAREEIDAQTEHRKMLKAARRSHQRAMDSTQTDARRQKAVLALRRADKAWHTEVRHQVALMELEGRSRDEIANALGLTSGAVGNVLFSVRRWRSKQTAAAIDLHRAILLERAEMIIRHWAKIALDDDLWRRIERRSESVSAKSLELAMRATFAMLAAMNFECRLLGLYATRGAMTEENRDPSALLEWLMRQVPFVEALAKSMPSDMDVQSTQQSRPETADDSQGGP